MTTILVVDDEPQIRAVVGLVLREAGYEVVAAANGAEALERMHQRPPDAVLLDLVMPIMDGQAFLGACRADPAYRMLPVALFSTLGSEAMTLDVQARVPKPFELEELTDAIALLVGQPVETAIAPAPPEWAAAPLNDAVLLRRRARGTHLTIRRSCMTIRAASACLQRATARLQRAYQPRALPAAMPRLG